MMLLPNADLKPTQRSPAHTRSLVTPDLDFLNQALEGAMRVTPRSFIAAQVEVVRPLI